MKKLFSAIAVLVMALGIGCGTLEHTAYVAIGGATTAVELSRQAYINRANTCQCVTQSEFTKVQSYYVKYQASLKVAQDLIVSCKTSGIANDNAIQMAVNAVTASGSDVVKLIQSLLPKNPPAAATNSVALKQLGVQ